VDETRAISDAVVKLPGVMVGSCVSQYTRDAPRRSRIRIDMLDQRAADAAATRIVRNKQVLKIAVSLVVQADRW
jgi:hypothetical protein